MSDRASRNVLAPVSRVAGLAIAYVLAIGITTQSVPAFAQEVTGSMIKRKEAGATGRFAVRENGSARAGVNAYSRCLAELEPALARRVLSFAYRSEAQGKALDGLLRRAHNNSGACFSADELRMSASITSYVGGFAEYFVLHKYSDDKVKVVAAEASEAWLTRRSVNRAPYERFGACVVDASPNVTYNLVMSEPDSDAEKDAINAALPFLGPCMAAGFTVKFDRSSLRSILAVSLFQAFDEHEDYMRDAG